MKKIAIILSLLPILLGFSAARSLAADPDAAAESISGTAFSAIQAAMPEFTRNNLDISRYRITVTQSGPAIFVTFIDADTPDGAAVPIRDNAGGIPAFGVELNRHGLTVVGSSFTR